jgi:hypothetical protein
MGRDTKYLTLALIVLMIFATLIVLFPRKAKVRSSEDFHSETDIERVETTPIPNKSSELYADNSNNTNTGADASTVADAYKVLSDGKVGNTTVAPPTPAPKKVEPAKPAVVPNAYEELTKPKKTVEKFTSKGGEASIAPKESKLNTNKLSGFLVVTNQFGSKENALKEVEKLKAKGYENANFITLDNKVFMAYAGWTNTKEDATKLLGQLKKKSFKPIIKDLN